MYFLDKKWRSIYIYILPSRSFPSPLSLSSLSFASLSTVGIEILVFQLVLQLASGIRLPRYKHAIKEDCITSVEHNRPMFNCNVLC